MLDVIDLNDLKGKTLVAINEGEHNPLQETVVLICSHNNLGSMGLITNVKLHSDSKVWQLFDPNTHVFNQEQMYLGGTDDINKFYLLRQDNSTEEGINVVDDIRLFGDLSHYKENCDEQMVMLGCIRWDFGVLKDEIIHNKWLVCNTDTSKLFQQEGINAWRNYYSSVFSDSSKDTGGSTTTSIIDVN